MVITACTGLCCLQADKPTLGNRGQESQELRGQQGPSGIAHSLIHSKCPKYSPWVWLNARHRGSDAIKCEGCSWDYKFVKKGKLVLSKGRKRGGAHRRAI